MTVTEENAKGKSTTLLSGASPDDDAPIVMAEETSPSAEANAPPEVVAVIAPSTLSEGYTFTAQVEGREFLVRVPEGGVTEGQRFEVPYPTESDFLSASSALAANPGRNQGAIEPGLMGRWRNGLCSCCQFFCNGLFWQACCCEGFLLGQLMERMHLDWCGDKTSNYSETCNIVSVIFLVYIVAELMGIGFVFAPIWLVYFVIAVTRLRYTMRKRYEIKPSCSASCDGMMDDCCCSFWCGCCVMIQMESHTHDSNYPYACCTNNGLPDGAPAIV